DRAQIFSSPQNGDAGVSVSSPGAFDGSLISAALFSRGSMTAMMSELWMDPYTNPLAFIVGVRSSVAATSVRRLVGRGPSHLALPVLRSRPAGRGGACGEGPAAGRPGRSPQGVRCPPHRLCIWGV